MQRYRLSSWERFAALPLPTEAEEIWRYSRIDELDLGNYAPVPEAACAPLQMDELPPELEELVLEAGPTATVILVRNGGEATVLRPQLGLAITPVGREDLAGEGLAGEDLAGEDLAGDDRAAESQAAGPDAWAALNGAFVRVPWKVTVAPGAELAAPVVVVHWAEGEGAAVFPRLQVDLGANASARVLEVVASSPASLLVVPLTELALGQGSRLDYGQVQVLGERAWQLGNQASRVSRDASLRSMTVAFGGDYARSHTGSVLGGPGGTSELLAAYFGSRRQMHDLRTVQHHAAERTRSDLMFKGLVAGEARSVYSGLIRVEKGAKGTNAFQTNRNLVLSEGAQAYSVPNLEIEDNDVRCSHASAVGPIDESQLFYLESRGVPTVAAQRLIATGFMDDVLARFPVTAAEPWLRRSLARKLAAAEIGQGAR